jgi:hypothetical protein
VLSAVAVWVSIAVSRESLIGATSHGRSALDGALLSAYALWFYLHKLLVPLELSALYAYDGIAASAQAAAALAVAAGAAALWKVRHTRPRLFFSAAWALVTLAPLLPWMIVRPSAFSDRYLYLGSIGLFFIAGETAAKLSPWLPGVAIIA